MITLVPLATTFAECAAVLDDRSLAKVRTEILPIYNATFRRVGPWANHPAVEMWRGSEYPLLLYGLAVCDEWQRRGHEGDILHAIQDKLSSVPSLSATFPPWWGTESVHASHRAYLAKKFPQWYRQYGWPSKFDGFVFPTKTY